MNHIAEKIKKLGIVLFFFVCITTVTQHCEITTCAYTQEEIEAAKAWLSANGYSPDEGGAAAAYADYMNGKFGAIPGLPEPNNVQPKPDDSADTGGDATGDNAEQDDADAYVDEDTDTDEDSENDGQAGDSSDATGEDSAPTQGNESKAGETPENTEGTEDGEAAIQGVTIPPDIMLTEESKEQFLQMVSVFADEFEEREQERIREAKERLEKQKAARAEAEREAEQIQVEDKKPQKNVILILVGGLVVATGALLYIAIRKNVKTA